MPIHNRTLTTKMNGSVWEGQPYESSNDDIASGLRQRLMGIAWLDDRSECGPVTLQPEAIDGDDTNINIVATATSYGGCAADAVSALLEAIRAPADIDGEIEADMATRISAKLVGSPLAGEITAMADHQPENGAVTLDDFAASLATVLFRYRHVLRA